MPKAEKTLSVFVDESGTFRDPDPSSRYYIVALVFHDQAVSIEDAEKALVHELADFGIVNLCFHAGPVIHATTLRGVSGTPYWVCRGHPTGCVAPSSGKVESPLREQRKSLEGTWLASSRDGGKNYLSFAY